MTESAEDAEAKRLLAQMGDDGADDDDDDDDEDDPDDPEHYDDMLRKFRRTVYPGENELDHVLLGCADLTTAIEDFKTMTGVEPLMVTSLNGCGTKSARAAFKDCSFIEIVAPDPKQALDTPFKQMLAKLPPGKMVPLHYAIRDVRAAEWKYGKFKDLKLSTDKVTMVAKDDGMPWMWDMYFLGGHEYGGLVPFYCNWGDGPHAAARLPIVGTLDKVKAQAPPDCVVHELLDSVVGNLTLLVGDPLLEFQFTSSKGTHTFQSTEPIGVSFPAEGGLPVKMNY
jgi:hypothetical protein